MSIIARLQDIEYHCTELRSALSDAAEDTHTDYSAIEELIDSIDQVAGEIIDSIGEIPDRIDDLARDIHSILEG